jgi:hypothetical protein
VRRDGHGAARAAPARQADRLLRPLALPGGDGGRRRGRRGARLQDAVADDEARADDEDADADEDDAV